MINNKLTYQDYTFVGIQLLLFAGYILPINFIYLILPDWVRYLGFIPLSLGVMLGIVALLQLNTKLSPFPTPVTNGKLITNGAFAIARHPIYTAILMASFGYAIFQQSTFKVLVFILLFLLFYFKSKYEERLLLENFPAYSDYKRRTRRFI